MTRPVFPQTVSDNAALVPALQQAALEAGRVIMNYYADGCAVQSKKDATPVTEADHAAEAIILEALARIAPGVPVVAEEEAAAGRLPEHLGGRFFLVDPLDGTREFLQRNGDFTVNIGLIEDGVPVLGLVYAPARKLLFIGSYDGAFEITTTDDHEMLDARPIAVRIAPPERIAVCSRSHATAETQKFLTDNQIRDCVAVGSSLKFCLLARGEVDIYPRFGPTMQWDTAAGDAVLRAAGGMTACFNGRPLTYGVHQGLESRRFENPNFIAYGAGDAPVFPVL